MKRALSILLLVTLLIPSGNVAFFSEGTVKVPQRASVATSNSVEVSTRQASSESLAGDLYFSEARAMTKASAGKINVSLDKSIEKGLQTGLDGIVFAAGAGILFAIFAFAGWLKGLIF